MMSLFIMELDTIKQEHTFVIMVRSLTCHGTVLVNFRCGQLEIIRLE